MALALPVDAPAVLPVITLRPATPLEASQRSSLWHTENSIVPSPPAVHSAYRQKEASYLHGNSVSRSTSSARRSENRNSIRSESSTSSGDSTRPRYSLFPKVSPVTCYDQGVSGQAVGKREADEREIAGAIDRDEDRPVDDSRADAVRQFYTSKPLPLLPPQRAYTPDANRGRVQTFCETHKESQSAKTLRRGSWDQAWTPITPSVASNPFSKQHPSQPAPSRQSQSKPSLRFHELEAQHVQYQPLTVPLWSRILRWTTNHQHPPAPLRREKRASNTSNASSFTVLLNPQAGSSRWSKWMSRGLTWWWRVLVIAGVGVGAVLVMLMINLAVNSGHLRI